MRRQDRTNDHKWNRINNNQSKCKNCGVIKTMKTIDGVFKPVFQTNDTVIHTEYIECEGKPDLSEFYS